MKMISLMVITFLIIYLIIFQIAFTEDNWKVISKYNTSIKKTETEVYSPPDENYWNQFKYDKSDEDFFVLNPDEHKRLARFLKKNIKFEIPMIIGVIESNIVKYHKIVFIKEFHRTGTAHIPILVFALEKNGEKIYRFGKFETDDYELKCDIATDEICNFNEIMNKEKLDVDNPSLALDVVKLFLMVVRYPFAENILENNDAIITSVEKKCSNEIEQLQKLVPKWKELIHSPMYQAQKDFYLVKFFLYYTDCRNVVLDFWQFKVKRDGEVELLAGKLFLFDISKGEYTVVARQ